MRRGLLPLVLTLACTENALTHDDLGPFYIGTDSTVANLALDYPKVDGLVFDIPGPYIVLAGFTRQITPSNPDPGEPLPHVTIRVKDMSQTLLAETQSDDHGGFVLAVPIPTGGTDGYVEVEKEGLPTVRQFDRRLDENWTTMRLRMLDYNLYSIPRQILGQKDDLGYIQGSVYDKVSELPLPGIRVEASAGQVAYLSDGIPVPKTDLSETQSQGVFFVANCPPGPIVLRFIEGSREIATRTVLTWPKTVLTQVGVPVVR